MQHLDEGTIHAWLDGQLPADEAHAVEAHVAECRQCADAVAEARGLIAASSRILLALDGVPREVAPKSTAPTASPGTPELSVTSGGAASGTERTVRSPRRRWLSGPLFAAAATIFVAVGTLTVMRSGVRVTSEDLADRVAARVVVSGPMADSSVARDAAPPAVAPAATPSAVPPAPAAGVTPGVANEAPAAPALERRQALADAGLRESATGRLRNKAGFSASAGAADAGGANAPARPSENQDRVAVTQQTSTPRDEATRLAKEIPAPRVEAPRPDTLSVKVFRGAKAEEQSQLSRASRADAVGAVGPAVVRGRVTDANNTGLAGALVKVDGTSIGVTTDTGGSFVVQGVPTGAQRLVVRRIGYAPADRTVTVAAGDTISANVVLAPTPIALENVVVTGSASTSQAGARQRAQSAAPAPVAPVPADAAKPQQSTAVGCYELGITPSSTQARTGFREVPRRVALDSTVAPGRGDGVWYHVRDLGRTGAAPNGVWRPAGSDVVDIEWSYGTRTARVRLTGTTGSMARGTIEEIDRATVTGEAGTVVAVRRPCGG